MDVPASAEPSVSRRLLASWLGVLFVLVFVLNAAGGWVRLSGSGVAIPHWPVIDLGTHRTLLPPFNAAGWDAAHGAYLEHQARLQERVVRGDLAPVNLGRLPADRAEFRGMFLTEWSHRLLAALVGVLAAGCLTTVLRRADLRRAVGLPFGIVCVLIVVQALVGGLLVAEGTNTRWLFLHQGNAGMIMSCLLWSVLRLLQPSGMVAPRRAALVALLACAVVWVWLQLVSGAMVSSSRHQLPPDLRLGLGALPALWVAEAGVGWNLLENARLHQWLHRWPVWGLVALLVAVYAVAWSSRCGVRQRLALQVSATFLGVQIMLGLASALVGAHPFIALGHQAMGMGMLMSVVLALHDGLYEEPASESAQLPAGTPA